MNVRGRTAWIALPVAMLLGVTACGNDPNSEAGGAGAVTVGIAEPEHLVPSNTVEVNGTQVIVALFTPLVRFDGNGKPALDQAAAQSITSSDDKTWTIKLRSGFTFHNGEPVTADNYINAWNYAAYGPNLQLGAGFFDRIAGFADLRSSGARPPKSRTLSGLKKVDDLTFTVTLSQPFAEWEYLLGYNVFYPLPNAAFNADGSLNDRYELEPIGQGPFKMKGSWSHNQGIDVEQYEAYPLSKPKVHEVDFKIYQDQDTQYGDLQAGNLDVQPQIPSDKLGSAQSELGDRLRKTPSSYFGYITVPTYLPAYHSLDIRKAISMAINRQEIVDKIFQGAYTPATSWVSPLVQGYRKDTCGTACQYNPTAAKSLYDQAGGVPGNKIQLFYNSDGGHKEWVDAVCNQLSKNLGVECTPSAVPQFADLRKQVRGHTLPGVMRGAWAFDYPSIEDYLTPIYKTGGDANDSGYSNAAVDQALAAADQTLDEAGAIKKYQHVEDLIAKDMPTIPMWYRQNIYGYSTNMKHVNMDPFGNVDVFTLERK